MVVFDSQFVILLFDEEQGSAPLDDDTGEPVTCCAERIEYLIQTFSEAGERILIPTPVLSEVLVRTADKQEFLEHIIQEKAFYIADFDLRAAIEVAELSDPDLDRKTKLSNKQTWAKVKYDRQIIAIAKVNGATVIYTNDGALSTTTERNGIQAIKVADLPLPPQDPQASLDLD